MRRLIGLLTVAVVGACLYFYLRDDPLRAELNRRWPPANAEVQRQAAIDSAEVMLGKMQEPNLAAGIDAATIQAVLLNELNGRGVSGLSITTERQLLRASVDFDMTLRADDLPPDSDERALVAKLVPRIVGHVNLRLGAMVTIADDTPRALKIKVLPTLDGIRVDKLSVAGSYDLGATADAIAFLLNRYADNLGSAMATNPSLNLTLPASFQDDFDISRPLKVDLKEAPDLKLVVSGRKIRSPYRLAAASILIDQGRIVALAQMAPADAKAPDAASPTTGGFESFEAAFRKKLDDAFAKSEQPAGVWAAVGKRLLADSLNNAFAQADACLSGSGPIPKEEFSKKVPIPNEDTIDCTPKNDCTPTRDCTPTDDCTPAQDCSQNRECRKCALGVCVNDPVCEGEKALAKGKCEAVKSGRKLDCERLKSEKKATCEAGKSAEKLACETEKTSKKALCETAKEGLKRLSRTGNFANIDGSIAGNADFKLCPRNVQFFGGMDNLSLALEATGSAAIDTHFKFVPLDAAHILCPLEWTADKRINTAIPQQSLPVMVSLARKPDAEKLAYQANLEEIPIKLHFEPSPLSLVLQNVNFNLACPIAAGFVNGITLGLAPLIPEFAKDYTYRMKGLSFVFAPELATQDVFGRRLTLKMSENARAVVLSGTP